MELNKYVLEKAIASGICEDWADKIAAVNSLDDLLKMYIKGIDFCLNNDFPAREDLLRFGGDKLHQYGICIDKRGLLLESKKFLVLLGGCETELTYSGFSVSQLFVKHTSKTKITAINNSFLVVDCFDNTNINITAKNQAKVLVNVYGNAKIKSQTEANGIVKIIHKNKNTY